MVEVSLGKSTDPRRKFPVTVRSVCASVNVTPAVVFSTELQKLASAKKPLFVQLETVYVPLHMPA